MPVFAENTSTIADQIRLRKPRNQFNQQQQELISAVTDPNPHISRPSKSTIASLFLSPFSTNTTDPTGSASTSNTKKKGAAFRGLGCTAAAAQQVSVPAVIRASAEWEGKRMKKKKTSQQQKQKRKKESIKICSENHKASQPGAAEGSNSNSDGNGSFNPGSCMVIQDVWCGPGIGFSADAVVGSVDCVVARRNVSGRGKIDGENFNPREREREREKERERHSCLARRAAVNPETISFLDSDPAFVTSRPEPELFGTRHYRHVRHPSPDGLAEMMMLQTSFMMGGTLDRFRNWRLDIDNMSYEELIELGDKIGYVNTGLKDDEISRFVMKIKPSVSKDLSSRLPVIMDKKCSICQEEYEAEDELGKLVCGHGFHMECIKQWLAQKNACPVCKAAPVPRG